MSKQVNVRFNETALVGSRVFGFNEEHVITQDEADRLGETVTVLGDAENDFPSYEKSVYGDNEAAKQRDPKDPADVEAVTVGESDVKADREVEQKDVEAPENKAVGKSPAKK